MSQLIRLLLEWGPLVVFFVANANGGIMVATAAFMVAAVVALPIYRKLDGKWPLMPLVTCGFVLVFGGLTLWLNDETFIKVKATIIYLLFALALAVGVALRRNLLAQVLVGVDLDQDGWRRLTVRWMAFFLVLAGANEVAWRFLTTDQWVAYKSFVVIPLFVLFSMAQVPLILKHQVPEAGGEAGDKGGGA
ncbi:MULTISPECIES: septation protein A [Nitrospirillum]|uniref:Inner membrane-spanning protein YciB n=1 Tax=Nitrospirillum viridazoti CBAmc TaxID=1441467 RepID=A0A248JRQ0_9PROT|nr:septation protein A [Nitrospirillum amazonense]ASG21289.1 septation protein A [Nitrospirillum amazonense CBAmc]MEC4594500.1 septation protein A [Nitrospirillum amazonense]TWB32952.1 intracellular septation protein [Nitrospirillum amazonense]